MPHRPRREPLALTYVCFKCDRINGGAVPRPGAFTLTCPGCGVPNRVEVEPCELCGCEAAIVTRQPVDGHGSSARLCGGCHAEAVALAVHFRQG